MTGEKTYSPIFSEESNTSGGACYMTDVSMSEPGPGTDIVLRCQMASLVIWFALLNTRFLVSRLGGHLHMPLWVAHQLRGHKTTLQLPMVSLKHALASAMSVSALMAANVRLS